MSALITIIHVIVCIILIVAVLLQSGKAADLAGAFGGVGSQSVFGPRSATTLLSKMTTISAVLFMITSLGLWILSGKGGRSVVSGEEAPPPQETPAAVTETKKEAEEPTTQEGKKQTPEKKAGEATEDKTKQSPDKKQAPQTKEKKESDPEKQDLHKEDIR
jgi:preprotein translocase subunit SecG